MREDLAVGDRVMQVGATGAEEVAYGIAGGNTGSAFDVDASTGAVFVKTPLDYETTREYELWLKTFFFNSHCSSRPRRCTCA